MAGAYKPSGTQRFWLNGLPSADLLMSAESGAQKYWIDGVATGAVWTGLRNYPEVRWLNPAGPQRGALGVRYWLDGLPIKPTQKGTNADEGSQKYWLNGLSVDALWPSANVTVTFPPHFLAP
jgi:hypothetical protein